MSSGDPIQPSTSVPGSAVAIDRERVLWRAFDGARQEWITPHEAAALDACAVVRTREQQVEAIAQFTGQSPLRAARVYDALAARGLIAGLSDWLVEPRARPPRTPAPEPLLVIRSFERPAGLQALLDSLREDERRFGVRRRYLIVDDSARAECAMRTRALAAAFAHDCGSRVHLLAHDERPAALEHVLGALDGCSREVLLQMLCPQHPTAVTGSRTWNWATLAAAGQSLSILDDDVLFPLRRIDPVPDQRLDLRPGLDAATRFLDSSQVLRPPLLEQEPYAYLCNYVGASTQALLARDGHAASSALGVAAASLMHLRHDARVVGAVPGIYGSLPFGSSAYLTCTDADSNANLWRKPFELERLQADRIVHGVRTPRLVPEAVYTPLLLDARELLPFAGTWGRVDDQYFLMLLKAIAGNIAFALVPALLGHADHAPRRRLERAREALLLDRNAFIAFVFAQSGATLASSDRTLRLAAVGRICAELAAADDAELALRILSWRSNMIGHLCAHLAAALEQFPHAPPAWRTHVQAILTANRTALELPTLDAQDLTAYRAGLQQAAAAAELWPVIWQKMLDQPLLERLPRL